MLDALARLDVRALLFFNELWGRTPWLNDIATEFADNDLVKSGLAVGVLWAFWYQRHPHQLERRRLIVSMIVGALVAAAVCRALVTMIPNRVRPTQMIGLALHYPWPEPTFADTHGSFPSDHAALAMALATAVFVLSRPHGALVAVYMIAFVLLPRAYTGRHWPADLVAGSIVGIATTAPFAGRRIRDAIGGIAERVAETRPALFHALMFLVGFEVMRRFDEVRNLIAQVGLYLRH